MIIGSCGAGKSTLSRQLHQKTGIELIHLDQAYWKPNWIETEPDIWDNTVRELVKKESWIIDGNYGGTMDIRLQTADTIIFLDRSRWLCLYRVLKRIIMNYGKPRADMNEGCNERFDWGFLIYVFHFYDIKRPQILKRLSKLPATKQIYVLKSNEAMQTFLNKF